MNCDVLIIGAGPAGLSAGIYSARGCLKTVIAEKGAVGGQAATTWEIENYPGAAEGVTGPELTERMRAQAESFGVQFVTGKFNGWIKEDGVYSVAIGKEVFQTKTIIIAAGAEPRLLGCPGEQEHRGMGVSYCATCDANFYRNLDVAVVGGGDTAVEEALYLTKFAKKVTIIHRRDKFRAVKLLEERAKAHPQIEIMWDSVVDEIVGKPLVNGAVVRNLKTGAVTTLKVDGVFVFVGQQPGSAPFADEVACDERGYIITDDTMATNLPGVFAAGDIRPKTLRQVVTATADGAIAAVSAMKYIEERF